MEHPLKYIPDKELERVRVEVQGPVAATELTSPRAVVAAAG